MRWGGWGAGGEPRLNKDGEIGLRRDWSTNNWAEKEIFKAPTDDENHLHWPPRSQRRFGKGATEVEPNPHTAARKRRIPTRTTNTGSKWSRRSTGAELTTLTITQVKRRQITLGRKLKDENSNTVGVITD